MNMNEGKIIGFIPVRETNKMYMATHMAKVTNDDGTELGSLCSAGALMLLIGSKPSIQVDGRDMCMVKTGEFKSDLNEAYDIIRQMRDLYSPLAETGDLRMEKVVAQCNKALKKLAFCEH